MNLRPLREKNLVYLGESSLSALAELEVIPVDVNSPSAYIGKSVALHLECSRLL